MLEPIRTSIRSDNGSPAIFFVALIITASIIIAGITAFAEFTIIQKKIETAMEEGEHTALTYLKENLTDGMIGLVNVQPILDEAKTLAIAAIEDSLGQATKDFLIARNPGSLADLFSSSNISLVGSDINITFTFLADVGTIWSWNCGVKTQSITLKPSEINTVSIQRFDCADCGDCGRCDTFTGQCVPLATSLELADIQLQEAEELPNAADGYDCKSFYDTLQGAFCKDMVANHGWAYFGTALGGGGILRGCHINSVERCRMVSNYAIWELDPSNAKAYVYTWSLNPPTEVDISATQVTVGSFTYERGDQVNPLYVNPYETNSHDAHALSYPVCQV